MSLQSAQGPAWASLTWGDPFVNQLMGSDAQAIGTDPAAAVVAAATTGPDQLGQLAGGPENCPSWDFLCKGTGGWIGIGPGTGMGTSTQPTNGITTAIDQNVNKAIIGLVAIVLLAIGVWALLKG